MIAQVDRVDDDGDEAGRIRDVLSGLPHEEEWVLASDLEIDHSYQRRHVRAGWVKEIADGFDPDLLRPLLVNRRRWDSGRLFVMDGQHRLLAIRRMGWGEQLVPCLVYDNLPYTTEAKLFDTQGYNRPLTQQERFRSALERREPDAETIDGIVRHTGFQLNLDDGDMLEGRIPGVGALTRILRQHRSGMLTDVLEACRDGFGREVGPRAELLAGMAKFLARYRNHAHYDRRRLVTALKTKSAGGLLVEAADVRRSLKTHRLEKAEAIAFVVHGAYNYRLPADGRRLPEWTFGRAKSKG